MHSTAIIIEHIDSFKRSGLEAADISGWFGDSFQAWTVEDFGKCAYNNLTQLRKILREKGVYVNTGRTKPEVIEALMAAIKEEIPWPTPYLKSDSQPSEPREEKQPQRQLSFQPKRKDVEDT
ncbi:hypothetical protein GcM3_016025 [Golovinomyces cichoracearum]|uniref:Uncharacterized protein n=1 Tax=Golovinomyces cichoracearum TaxID=62708 RepID=A0A420J8N5_9PEZI|nr:hypothetical protein GcM3_016025 [Golovinomyces cichoracearum]